MAKSTALARYRPPPVIVTLPRSARRVGRARSRSVARIARGRSRRVVRKGGGAAASSASLLTIGAGGAAVGYIAAKGYLSALPPIGGSRMITLGVAGFALTKFTKNKYLRAAGLAAVAAAAFDFGRIQGGGTIAGDDGGSGDSAVEGEDDDAGQGY